MSQFGCFLHKDPFPFLRAQYVLSCHIIKVAWPNVVLPGAGPVFQSCSSSTVFDFGEGESWNNNDTVLAAQVPARLLTIVQCSPRITCPEKYLSICVLTANPGQNTTDWLCALVATPFDPFSLGGGGVLHSFILGRIRR